MKGKKEFTRDEANQITSLIRQKLRATRSEQRRIRVKIRKLGFYFSDFSDKKGYDVADFEALIRVGTVSIVEQMANNGRSTKSDNPKHTYDSDETIKKSVDLLQLEKELILNGRFKKAKDIDNSVPNRTGFYCIRLAGHSKLPKQYQFFLDKRKHRIIYIGKAEGQTLRDRFLHQELRAKGHGTFFRTIGAVLGFRPPKGSLKGKSNQRNYKFSVPDTSKIIKWINSNLEVTWMEYSGPFHVEVNIIRKYEPLLNIMHNPQKLAMLANDRRECVQIAIS